MKCRSELFVLTTEPLKLILCSRSNTQHADRGLGLCDITQKHKIDLFAYRLKQIYLISSIFQHWGEICQTEKLKCTRWVCLGLWACCLLPVWMKWGVKFNYLNGKNSNAFRCNTLFGARRRSIITSSN